jgi:hypothetical protein
MAAAVMVAAVVATAMMAATTLVTSRNGFAMESGASLRSLDRCFDLTERPQALLSPRNAMMCVGLFTLAI